jgi:putative zinc finger/helix-turn-helix YgiT family protein
MKKNANILCPSCEKGHFHPKTTDYMAELPDGLKLTIPNVKLDVCDHCGEIAISIEAAKIIDATIAEQNEQLSPHELENIRENLNLDQTEMSEVLGLGGKTYHRWEKGTQIPSRSMCHYLRVLGEFPEAFDWLRNRQWRRSNRIAASQLKFDFSEAFPDLKPSQLTSPVSTHTRFNPARALFGAATV